MAPWLVGAERTYGLLDEPKDVRYMNAIAKADPCVRFSGVSPWLIEQADIVQFEYWDHPSLLALLATELPPMRAVFWQHKRSLPKPPGRVVYTSEASGKPSIPSGFGIEGHPSLRPPAREAGGIAYLGTVNLSKMSPVFFDVMDRIPARAHVWGHVGEGVEECVRGMNAPYRIVLEGHTANPVAALRRAGIFFYPLQPDHYGTGENALCEAMSLGLVPVVLNNEVERLIVGDAGIICQNADSCVSAILRLMSDANLMRNMSERAIERARAFSPERSAAMFMELWAGMMAEPLQVLPVVPIVDPERQPAPPRTSASPSPNTGQSERRRRNRAPGRNLEIHS